MFGEPGVAKDDAVGALVEDAAVVQLDRRYDQTLAPHVGGPNRQASGHHASDVVVMAEHLAETDQAVTVEYGHGSAQVRDMPDAAARVVGVVPEEDIPRVNVAFVEVLEHRFDQRGV